MNRSRTYRRLGACLILAVSVLAASPNAAPAGTSDGTAATDQGRLPANPDIVVILTDDQRWDTLWSMHHVQDLLVDHGVTFSNTFVSNSLCCPSRVAMLTGQYSHTSGVYTNEAPYGGFTAFNDTSDIATWLTPTYTTALVGKYLNEYETAGATGYIPPGWDRFVGFLKPRYYNYQLNVDGTIQQYGSARRDYSTSVLTDYATDFIRNTTGPLFLWYTPHGPHGPQVPAKQDATAFSRLPPWRPPSYNEADVSDKPTWMQAQPSLTAARVRNIDKTRLNQYRTLRSEDRSVADIVDALDQTGRLANTMIVFASDNGFGWGEHRLMGKQSPYEESIRIPMVVRYDPLTAVPRTDDHMVVNIDYAPTFADLAGVGAPGADGISLLPLLEGTPESWQSDFLLEHLQDGSGPGAPTYCGVRTTQYTYVRYDGGEDELYDLATDPFQLTNVASSPNYTSVRDSLRLRLAELCSPPPPGFTLPVP